MHAGAGPWTVAAEVDRMTDRRTEYAVTTTKDGVRFGVFRREGGQVSGFVELPSDRSFAAGKFIDLRVDKNKAHPIDDKLERLEAKYGLGLKETWRWTPKQVVFLLRHGDPTQGCGFVGQLLAGSGLLIRYTPGGGTAYEHAEFELTGAAEAIGKALGLAPDACKAKTKP